MEALPLFFYHDDFEVCNELSVTAGVYKVGGTYFSIPRLPPKYSSIIENIFFAQFIHTEDQNNFGNEKCFRKMVDEINYLFLEGMTINVKDKTYQVFFVVAGII